MEQLNESVEQSLVQELNNEFNLGHSGILQFEIDPFDFRIFLIQTENDIVEEFNVSYEIEVEAEENDLDVNQMIRNEIVLWFSERWMNINGPKYYTLAYLYFHSGLEAPRFNLVDKKWVNVENIWPELIG